LTTIALTGEQPEENWMRDVVTLGAWFFATVCITLIATGAMRKWMEARDEHNRAALDEIARQRTALIEASERRMAQLNEREQRLNKQAEVAGAHVMSLASRLDEALTRSSALERQKADLTKQYEDLARDHNTLIRETLQERSDRFARRAVPASTTPPATSTPNNPARAYTDQAADCAPVRALPLRTAVPAGRTAEPTQHDRAAESVRGPA
jgi:hypothetical protein